MIWQKKLSFLFLFCLFLLTYCVLFLSLAAAAPSYTYTGSSSLINDGNDNYRIKFLSDGYFTPAEDWKIDVFLVGGGGGGRVSTSTNWGGSGAGGGYTATHTSILVKGGESYYIDIGAGGDALENGNPTSAFSLSISGGGTGAVNQIGGIGGSGGGAGGFTATGGLAGSDGSSGGRNMSDITNAAYYPGGSGQGVTTREFSESTGDLYAGGGGGGAGYGGSARAGGAGGGGAGAAQGGNGGDGTPNTGGGGGGSGAYGSAGKGGSGIVVIRLQSDYLVEDDFPNYSYTGSSKLVIEGNQNYKIAFLSSGIFQISEKIKADLFLVGGGAGGGTSTLTNWGGEGGGGGYTATYNSISINENSNYSITVGPEANADTNGNPTSAFSYTVSGGIKGSGNTGGGGGSGGGAAGFTDTGPAGGSNGSNGGSNASATGGSGQGVTTREFSESTGDLYAGGGGGGAGYTSSAARSLGGAGGGGLGGIYKSFGGNALQNSGGGGGGSGLNRDGGLGGSGIAIIRFLYDSTSPTINAITADQELNTASGETVSISISGIADTGGSGLAFLKYSYFIPGSSNWTETTIANVDSTTSFDVPITKEGTYYIKAAAADDALNWSEEIETSVFINRGSFSSPSSPSPASSFARPLQITDIVKGSYVSWNNYLFVKLGSVGETGPFLAVSPLCEQPFILASSGILDNTNTLYTGHLATPGQTTVAIISSPVSSMHGACTWSSTQDPTLSSLSYIDDKHCIVNLDTSINTTYTVSMTGCLTNPTTSLTVSQAAFEGE